MITFAEATRPSCVRLIGSIRKEIPQALIVILGRETHHPTRGFYWELGL